MYRGKWGKESRENEQEFKYICCPWGLLPSQVAFPRICFFGTPVFSSQKCWVTMHAVSIDIPDMWMCHQIHIHVPDAQAKQTKTSDFGAEKGLLQGHTRRQVAHAPPLDPKLSEIFQQNICKGQVREQGHRVYDQLIHSCLIGWW